MSKTKRNVPCVAVDAYDEEDRYTVYVLMIGKVSQYALEPLYEEDRYTLQFLTFFLFAAIVVGMKEVKFHVFKCFYSFLSYCSIAA